MILKLVSWVAGFFVAATPPPIKHKPKHDVRHILGNVQDFLGHEAQVEEATVVALLKKAAMSVGADESLICGMANDGYILGPPVPVDQPERAVLKSRVFDLIKRHPAFAFSPFYLYRISNGRK